MDDSTRESLTRAADAARLLAVEVLLADPEALGNDALETDLYILRDTLRAERPRLDGLPPPRHRPRGRHDRAGGQGGDGGGEQRGRG